MTSSTHASHDAQKCGKCGPVCHGSGTEETFRATTKDSCRSRIHFPLRLPCDPSGSYGYAGLNGDACVECTIPRLGSGRLSRTSWRKDAHRRCRNPTSAFSYYQLITNAAVCNALWLEMPRPRSVTKSRNPSMVKASENKTNTRNGTYQVRNQPAFEKNSEHYTRFIFHKLTITLISHRDPYLSLT